MTKICSALFFSTLFIVAGHTSILAQRVTVSLAGSGVPGYSGDGGSGKLAKVSGPKDVCMDAAENIYFSDKGNGVIRKIAAANGIITTIAGGGVSTADGIPAKTAFIVPNYICVSASGDLYFTTENKIRKVQAKTGTISTIAGAALPGYTGDHGPAIAATLNNPQGICIDAAGNVYVVDRGNNCIRKVDAATGKINTLIGNGTPGASGDGGPATAALLNGPVCICVSPAGDLVFSDQNPNYPALDFSILREINSATGIVTHIAGASSGYTFDVHPIDAMLGTVTGLCFAPSGHVYVNEMSCSCRQLDFTKDTLFLVAGNFSIEGYSDDTTAALANMDVPFGLCVDKNENVIIADSVNQRIRKIILLTHTPSFAYGHAIYIDPVAGAPYPLDSLLWITDADAGQLVTWSVVALPLHGTLSGFATTAASKGDLTTTKPVGLTYSPLSTYSGMDFFRIRVSDYAGLADTVTVFVGPKSLLPLSANGIAGSTGTIDVFPNPATSLLNIRWTGSSVSDIAVTDITGRSVRVGAVTGIGKDLTQIDISGLPKGVYVIKISGQEVRKFVKE